MKVLLVSHVFLPSHPAGTEIYTYQVGKALQARGHDVHVFTTEKDIARENLSVEAREYNGLPVHELFNNRYDHDFRDTWDYPAAAASFGVLLDDLKPDVVHFMHLLYLSVACVEEVQKRGIPVFYTLHDYWLQCARFGQRRYVDGSICHTIDFDKCGRCVAQFKWKQTRAERALGKTIAKVRSTVGLDLGDLARDMRRRVKQSKASSSGATAEDSVDAAVAEDYARSIAERDQALRERILPAVDRFIAPSRFLRERFLEWGIPANQIVHMRTGIDLSGFRDLPRRPQERTVISFIGTLAPHKGVHVLLDAWDALPDAAKQDAELRIYGPPSHNPEYVASLTRGSARVGAKMLGRLERDAVADVLAETDLLVVPSIWYENSPLIILEALAMQTPLAVSNLGGMAELVQPGATGFHFEMGDAEDLARVLGEVLAEPERLTRLFDDEVAVRDVTRDAEVLEESYRSFIRARVEADLDGSAESG